MIELVAFDMAGTTIDDHGLVYVALERCVTDAGATVHPRDLQLWMGTDKVTAIGALLRLGGVEPTQSTVSSAFDGFRRILAQSYRDLPPVALPGVEGALRELRSRGIRVALTTGFTSEVAEAILHSIGWTIGPAVEGAAPTDLLDAVVTTSDVPSGRPAPYLIHRAMERTGVVDVRRVLAAGDTIVDLLAARNAGVIGVGVLTGSLGRAELEAQPHDHILASVADVPGLAEATA